MGIASLHPSYALSVTGPSGRLDMICDLMKMHDIKLPQFNFGGLKTILSECKTYRDSVAHGVWLREPGTNVIHLRRIHGSWTPPGTMAKRTTDSS